MVEKDIEKSLVKRIEGVGGKAFKFTSPNRRSVPDRLVLLPGGKVMFVECKRPGGKPTQLQAAEHKRLRDLGFEVLVVDSMDAVKQMEV